MSPLKPDDEPTSPERFGNGRPRPIRTSAKALLLLVVWVADLLISVSTRRLSGLSCDGGCSVNPLSSVDTAAVVFLVLGGLLVALAGAELCCGRREIARIVFITSIYAVTTGIGLSS